MESLNEVVAVNRALLARARDLNTRAGTSLFPVQTRDELTKLFAVALGGARRVAEIRNMSALVVLPALDDQLVEKVLREQPDTITILGREATVEYRGGGYNPRVRLDFRGSDSWEWLKLPDTGIHLPGGREVSMYSSLEGYGYYVEANSSQFKAKARECLNQGLWNNWQKPELPTPTDFVSPIVEAEYGRCVVTNVSLIAFGTVNYDSWYGSWKSYWTRDRAEAERVLAEAKGKFVEAREKIIRDALKKRIGELYNAHNYNRELPEEMRTRLYNTYYGYSGGATTVAEITALIAEVEAEVEVGATRKAETERKQREAEVALKVAEARGEILRNFIVWIHTSSQRGDGGGYVIRPDGSLRECDREQYERPPCRGRHDRVWDMVAADEAALEWCGHGTTVEYNHADVRKSPSTWTAAQLATLRQLAETHGCAGWKGAPTKEPTQPSSENIVDLSKVDLSKLFSGSANVRR